MQQWNNAPRGPRLAFAPGVTLERQALGLRGEAIAVAELGSRGYAILERRYRTRHGELDIVALDGDVVVFVEVRARGSGVRGLAAESVTRRKQRRLVRLAVSYLARHGLDNRRCRFDVVAIDAAMSERPVVTVYRSAFDVSG